MRLLPRCSPLAGLCLPAAAPHPPPPRWGQVVPALRPPCACFASVFLSARQREQAEMLTGVGGEAGTAGARRRCPAPCPAPAPPKQGNGSLQHFFFVFGVFGVFGLASTAVSSSKHRNGEESGLSDRVHDDINHGRLVSVCLLLFQRASDGALIEQTTVRPC